MTALDLDRARRELLGSAPAGSFDPSELDGLPEPVRRYFQGSVAPGTEALTAARLGSAARSRLGVGCPSGPMRRSPHGVVSCGSARAAGVISGYDAYIDGHGAMRWKLLGLATLIRAAGTDVSTSAAGRCAGEALWLPTALLPRFGVEWSAAAADRIVAKVELDTTPMELHIGIDAVGRPTSVVFDRWGDPEGTGSFGWHPFGGDIAQYDTFAGLTIPSAGSWGWFYGTERWQQGGSSVPDH